MLYIPPTNLLLLAAKQEPRKNVYLLTKNFERLSKRDIIERTNKAEITSEEQS